MRLTVQKIPTNPWYSKVLKVLFYLPAKLVDLGLLVGQTLFDTVCADPEKARAASSSNPYARIAVEANILLCKPPIPGAPPPKEEKVNERTGKKALPWGLIAAGSIALAGLLALLLMPPKRRIA